MGKTKSTAASLSQPAARRSASASPAAKRPAASASASTAARLPQGQRAVNSDHYTPAVQAALSRVEGQLAARTGARDRERMVAIDRKTGRVLHDLEAGGKYLKKGEVDDGQHFSLSKKMVEKMFWGVVTHNHPNGQSFSRDDIQFACIAHLNAIRAVGGRYTYEMRPNPSARPGKRGWSFDWWKAEGRANLTRAQADATRSQRREIALGHSTVKQADQNYWHEVWSRFAAMSGGRLLYTRTPHDGSGMQAGPGRASPPGGSGASRRSGSRSGTARTGQTGGNRGGGGGKKGGATAGAGAEQFARQARHAYAQASHVARLLGGT